MAIIVDSVNVVNSLESAPDRLRAEIGRYYSPANRRMFGTSFASFRSGIKGDFINEDVGQPSQQLIETKKDRIFVSVRDEQFRDQIQWNDYVKETIRTNTTFLDHQFSFENPEIENSFVKNYHDPNYEDSTKTIPSNQLLNYNLISYPHKSEVPTLQSIADIRTTFDNEDYEVDGQIEFDELKKEFTNRITNYSGDIEEVSVKQRNIFDLHLNTLSGYNSPLVNVASFPFYYSKFLPFLGSTSRFDEFNQIISRYEKSKNIFQSIKQDLSFSNRNFNIGDNPVSAKIYNFIELMTTTRIISLSEQTDELFLLPQQETEPVDLLTKLILLSFYPI